MRFFAVRRWAALIVAAVAMIAGAVAPGSALAVPGAAPAAAGSGALTDLFVYNSSSGASAVELANGSGGWNDVPGPRFSAGWQVYPGNYNGDGLTDLFVYNPSTGASYVELANGSGGWTGVKGPQFSAGWSVYPGSYGGSYTDLFVYNPSTGASYVELANGSGGWTGVKGPQFSAGWSVYPGSYGGSYTDLFVYNPSTGASYVELANGSGGWTGVKGPQFSAGWSVYPGSYGGSYTDLFVYNPSTGASYVELANGSGGWTGVKGPQFSAGWSVYPGRYGGSYTDLFVYNPSTGASYVELANGSGGWTGVKGPQFSAGWSVYPGRYGGSYTDLFVYNPSTGASYVELANGSGGWTGVKGPQFSTGWSVYPGDYGVAAATSGLPAMPVPSASSSFIGCSSSWYVDGNGAPDLWAALSSQHCIYSHPTSGWPTSANVAVFLQFGSYGSCVPNTSGTGGMPYYASPGAGACASQSWGAGVLQTISADWHAAFPSKNLFLVALTTNQGSGGYAGGQGWASLINGVDSANQSAGIGNVVVFAGSDIEDWCNGSPCTSDVSPQGAIDWQNGYLSAGHFPVINDGFLDCPVSASSQPGNYCGAPGWDVSDYAELFGSLPDSAEPNAQYTTPFGPVLNIPQFYSTWMVDQWAGLKAAFASWGGSYNGTYGPPAIVGDLTEVNSAYEGGACGAWWPNDAWAYAQNTDGIPAAFVTDIGWESSYAADSCG